MDQSRIAELLKPFLEEEVLTAADLNHISTYIDILLRWNARINLTAIRDPEEIVTRHFGESLFAARNLFPAAERRQSAAHGASRGADRAEASAAEQRKKLRVADVGSGAGFPGIPLKLWAPEIELTLIEANHKKATFLREIVRVLTLTDINIQDARAETLPPASFDAVTLRAVERFETVLPTAAGLVAPNGRLALLISANQLPTLETYLPSFRQAIPVPNSKARILQLCEPKITAVTR